MQRSEHGGVIISCDFCATDWDPATGLPAMTEGHHGSVLCLECLQRALAERMLGEGEFNCTLCLQQREATMPRWSNPARPQAVVCDDCIEQAARVFDRDPDVQWKRPR